jgi:hypothetical protein
MKLLFLLALIFCLAILHPARSDSSTVGKSPFAFGPNANGKVTTLKSGSTWPVFFICGTNGGEDHKKAGFNTVFYELYADVSPESSGKTYAELFEMWRQDLQEIKDRGYAVIIYIHNHNHDRDRRGFFSLDEEWKGRVRRFVEEFKDLPNLAGWAFSDEPSDHIGYPVEEFRMFLKNKYATIQDLNSAWNAAFGSFEEIVLSYRDKDGNKGTGIPGPEAVDSAYVLGVSRKSFDAADYKLWRVRTAHKTFEAVVRTVDQKTPLWSGAHNLAWAATQVPEGWGAWCDAYPTYSGNDWFTHHVWFQQILRGQNYRPVIPMLMIETSKPDLSDKWNLDPRVWGGWMVQGALQASSGVAFWPWALLGEEYSENEVADAAKRLEFCAGTISKLEKSGVFEMKAENTIAVLYQPYAEGWAGQSQVYGLLANTGDEPLGLIEALTFGTPSGSVDYLTNDTLLAANLETYGVILAPFAADIPPEVLERLSEYVRKGGILVADMGFSAKNADGHLASMTSGAKELFGISKLKASRMEGPWTISQRLPSPLKKAGLTLAPGHSLRAQLSVDPSKAKAVIEGPSGQGLFVNAVGSGYAYYFSGKLWDRQIMANEVIGRIHLALFKNRSQIEKLDAADHPPMPGMANGGYQLFNYSSGFAVANLTDQEKDVRFKVRGGEVALRLAPGKAYLSQGGDPVEIGSAFFPAPALR